MPSFSRNLEETLHRAVAFANQRKHEYATLEHLLLALIDDTDAAQVMTACGVDLGDLSEAVKQYLDQEYQSLKTKEKADPAPTAGDQNHAAIQLQIDSSRVSHCASVPIKCLLR